MKFTKGILPIIRQDITAARAAVAAKHDIKFDLGTMRFDENCFSATLKAEVAGFSANANDFTTFSPSVGLDPTWLNATIHYARRNFKVDGLQMTGRGVPKIMVTDCGNNKPYLIRLDLFKAQATLVTLADGTPAPKPEAVTGPGATAKRLGLSLAA